MRSPLKNLGYALLGWVLNCGGAFCAFRLMFLGSTELALCYGCSALPSQDWQVNPFGYGFGAILSIACFVLIWKKILRGTLYQTFSEKIIWTLLWILLALLALFVQFMLFFIGMWLTIDFFDSPYPEWTLGFIFVYLAFAVVLPIADTVRYFRHKNQQTEAVT